MDFCPGIVQYYYETRTDKDYFYSAHVGGRIRPSDFPDLEGYLRRGERYLKACDLNVVAFSNHGKYDERVFDVYSRLLKGCIGFFYGWPGREWKGAEGQVLVYHDKVWIITSVGIQGNVKADVKRITSFIGEHKERPLFMTVLVVLGSYPDFTYLEEVKAGVEAHYPGQIEWVRGDELILLAREYYGLGN